MKKVTTREMILCALFTALTAIGAFIQIPVPGMDYFTLQFLFVLLAGFLLGSKLGLLSVSVYLLLGLFGLPIFAAGGGFTYVFRPSFGFLLAFAVTAFCVGFLTERVKKRTFLHYLWIAFAGFFITYAIGLVYKYTMLNFYVGEKTAFTMVLIDCFPLDMPGDIVLCFLASILALRLRPALQKING
ncbi:MAG: biotin transporter BioY [Lachnospiraceae bacterium]